MVAPNTCLIVDDEASVRLYLKRLLSEMGVSRIAEASNGHEAVEVFTRQHD